MLTRRIATFAQRAAFGIIAVAVSNSTAGAQTRSGKWDGTIKIEQLQIAFPFEISGNGNDIKGSFFNGDERVTSTSGRLAGKSLVLNFDHYATKLDATFENGTLKGTYGSTRRGFNAFEAVPHHDAAASSDPAPQIGGLWEIQNESPKGEHAWRFIVRQSGARVSAAILRVDGDTGLLVGDWKDGKYTLNHFDGARAQVIDVSPKDDGTLALTLKGARGPDKTLVAIRPSDARAKGLPEPSDFTKFTTVKDPNEPFRFSFADLQGNIVSNTDAKFRDKVVLVNITGSWCPNCHDEAPFLADIYRRYRSLGLEIVALDFEEPEQLKDLTRLPAFIKNYGIEYTYLVAGSPSELVAKIPQAVNLNSWPTTFFLGRDGKVRAVHAGFAAPASGEFNAQLKEEFTNTVERLLSETTRAAR